MEDSVRDSARWDTKNNSSAKYPPTECGGTKCHGFKQVRSENVLILLRHFPLLVEVVNGIEWQANCSGTLLVRWRNAWRRSIYAAETNAIQHGAWHERLLENISLRCRQQNSPICYLSNYFGYSAKITSREKKYRNFEHLVYQWHRACSRPLLMEVHFDIQMKTLPLFSAVFATAMRPECFLIYIISTALSDYSLSSTLWAT